MLTLNQRINLLTQLGKHLLKDTEELQAILRMSEVENRWFTKESSLQSLRALAEQFLNKTALEQHCVSYNIHPEAAPTHTIGLVLAGNIPAVGFHDVLMVFLSGQKAKIKCSDKDKRIIPFMIKYMTELEPQCADYLQIVPRLQDFDAVIATGSNSSALYFEQYFKKYPSIIRKHRNSVAILNGEEQESDWKALATDIFQYFGLGCRSVSKLYVPEGYNFSPLLGFLDDHYKEVMHHTKFKNNYDYNRSIYLLNQVPHLANDCIMLLEDESLVSRIATLHYSTYKNQADLETQLAAKKEEIQCIASKMNLSGFSVVGLGETQAPQLSDYADNVDTLQFLLDLK